MFCFLTVLFVLESSHMFACSAYIHVWIDLIVDDLIHTSDIYINMILLASMLSIPIDHFRPRKEAMAAMDTKFREFFPKLPKVRRFWLSSKNVFGWNKNCDHLTENNMLVVKEKKWGDMTKDVRVVKRLSLRWVKDKPCFFDQGGCSWIGDVAFCAEYC